MTIPILNGIKILDMTRLLPGPYATWLLAGMGADVVKVEQPGRGDYIRKNWPRRGDMSTVFHLYNQNKRSVGIDLKHPEGVAAFLDLVASADVVMDGNRPGVLHRLGCGWEQCNQRTPTLVWCAISGFGQEGPYAGRVGHDINYLSLSGVLGALRDAEGKPIVPRITIADMAGGGLMAVAGVLAALLGTRTSGQGRFVDISMTDSMLSMQGLRFAEDLFPGEKPGPVADDGLSVADDPLPDNDWEQGVYQTADGKFISLDPYEQRFKDELWRAVEEEGCATRPPLVAGRLSVRRALADAIAQRPRSRWEEVLSATEVCFAPVYDLHELPTDPNIRKRGLLGTGMDADERSPGMAMPIRFTPPAGIVSRSPAPKLGEHTNTVMRLAGWSDQRIDSARAVGALGGEVLTTGEV